VSAPPRSIPPRNTPNTPFRASTPTPQNTTRNTTFGSQRTSCHEAILLEDRASSTDGGDRPRQGKDHGKRTQPTNGPYEPLIYQIRIKGHLDPHWSSWFEGLAITLEDNGETLLTGPLVDQAALHGLIKAVRDLGIPLLSVVCVNAGQAETSEVTDSQ
jgi:hypothetical protein